MGRTLNQFYERLNHRVVDSEADSAETARLNQVLTEARRAYDRERSRADEAENRLVEVTQDRVEYMARFMREKTAHETLQVEHEKLRAERDALKADEGKLRAERDALQADKGKQKVEHEALQKRFKDECSRLREARDRLCIERDIKDGVIKRCEHAFGKVKAHLKDREKVDGLRQVYTEARGTCDALAELAKEGTVAVPEETIAEFEEIAADYKAQFEGLVLTELEPGDLEIPLVVDSVSLHSQAGVDPYGSNDGLVLPVLTPSALPVPTPVDPSTLPVAELVDLTLDPPAADATQKDAT